MLKPTLLASLALFTAAGLAPATAQGIGIAAAVNQSARGVPPSQAVRTIALGDNLIFNERIDTDAVGLVQILLADGTAFTVGPNSSITIDRFVYDPNAGTAQLSASLTKGVFRFVGGKTSKTPGGVSLKTPVGTVGIRGAVVDLAFEGTQGAGGASVPPHISMIFGKEVTLTCGSQVCGRLYQPGYSLAITNGQVRTVKTPAGWVSSIQKSLAGRPGTGGGSRTAPTEQSMAGNPFERTNSGVSIVYNTVPLPTPRPQVVPSEVIEVADVTADTVREEASADVDEPTGGGGNNGGGGDGGNGGGNGGGEVPAVTQAFRFQTARVASQQPSGRTGGSAEADAVLDLALSADGTSATGAFGSRGITLPLERSETLTTWAIDADRPAALGGVPLVGTLYTDKEGFAAYLLTENGDIAKPVLALTGTMTPASVMAGSDLRRYTLTRDLVQNSPVPLSLNYGLGEDGALVSDFLVLERPSGPGRFMQTSLQVQGSGVGQTSLISVNVGALRINSGGGPFLGGRRGGSVRLESDGIGLHLGGPLMSVTGTDEAAGAFFGSDGSNFVITEDQNLPQGFTERLAFGGAVITDYATRHVANLQSEVAGLTRTLGERRGYAAAISDGLDGYDNRDPVFYQERFRNFDPDRVFIDFDAEAASLRAEFEVYNVEALDSGAPRFVAGFGTRDPESSRAAYVDDQTFAAVQHADRDQTRLDRNNASYDAMNDPNSYLISSRAIPNVETTAFLQGTTLCECRFLEWGFWGMQAEFRRQTGDTSIGFHMGTFVTGDITRAADLAPQSGTTATYSGHAVGSVNTGSATYLAAGQMAASIDLGTRNGRVDVSGFDGRNFGAAVRGGETADAAFSGSIDTTGMSGSMDGALVNDGSNLAAGIIGGFDARETSSDWNATGIVAGQRLP